MASTSRRGFFGWLAGGVAAMAGGKAASVVPEAKPAEKQPPKVNVSWVVKWEGGAASQNYTTGELVQFDVIELT